MPTKYPLAPVQANGFCGMSVARHFLIKNKNHETTIYRDFKIKSDKTLFFTAILCRQGFILPKGQTMFDEDAWLEDITEELDEHSNRMENHNSMAYESGYEDEVSYSSAHSKRSRQMKAQNYN